MPKDYEQQKWFKLYKMAILGRERADLSSRIEDARDEIRARIGRLLDNPPLHSAEIHAIDNAHRMLCILENAEKLFVPGEKRSAIDEALRSITGKMEKGVARDSDPRDR